MLQQGIRNFAYGVEKFGLGGARAVHWNLIEPELYEFAISRSEAELTSGGALCAETGTHTPAAVPRISTSYSTTRRRTLSGGTTTER